MFHIETVFFRFRQNSNYMGRGNNPEELALAKKLTPSLSELAFKLLANLLNRRIYALLLSQKSQIKIFLKAHFQATKKFRQSTP